MIAENYKRIQGEIDTAAKDAKRDPKTVTLVAVTKMHPAEAVETLLNLGHRVFGENRVQEALEKYPDLKMKYPDLKLHLIGSLQTNKVKKAVELFDVIETLDSEELAEALAKEMKAQGKNIPCFIQVNTGAEPQKGGVLPDALEGFVDFAKNKAGLNVTGLMCIPPLGDPPSFHFALLADYAHKLGLANLSMGMSADFEQGIRFGSTHVRVGTALFGERT